ncbi:MAG: alpha/beta hydrolase [Acidimicrobiales bacterium]
MAVSGPALTWHPDVLGAGFEAAKIELRPDEQGRAIATLVRHLSARRSGLAVLYLHGFNDYFFQAPLARWFAGRGIDFYGLDMRKCGRSLLAHQTASYCRALTEYDEELDAAAAVVLAATGEGLPRDEPARLILVGHSTGGLTAPLWAARRPAIPIAGLVLNSPFLEFKQPAAVRAGIGLATMAVGGRRPMQALPGGVSSAYGESLHSSRHGEWDYDLAWKPLESFPVRLGWLAAIRAGHQQVHAGLGLEPPVLAMSSTRTITSGKFEPRLFDGDAVLDADSIARWSVALGRHVTCVRVPAGMHDLFLSRKEAREMAYRTLGTWIDAWVRPHEPPTPGYPGL